MTELQASRTLVKSPPELWAECSDAASLARHLDGFGEIRITRLEPETAVAWEGERARGTVRIEPAGWGTKVILTAEAEGVEHDELAPPAQSEPGVDEPEAVESPAPEPSPPEAAALEAPPPEAAAPEAPPLEAPPPEAAAPEAPPPEPTPPPRKRRFARLRAYWRGERLSEPVPVEEPPAVEEATPVEEPAAVEEPPAVPEPASFEEPPAVPEATEPVVFDTEAVLAAALDSLGQAHHRPYSRA
jgi:hypothetical protein